MKDIVVYCVFCGKGHKLSKLKTKPFFGGKAYFCGEEQIARASKDEDELVQWNGYQFEYIIKKAPSCSSCDLSHHFGQHCKSISIKGVVLDD